MKRGIFFWGFSNLDLVSELSRRIKKNSDIEECYVQIPIQEKTVYLLEMFPEEVIRAHPEDVGLLHQWLNKNNQKDVIVVLNLWPFLLYSDFSEKLMVIQDIIKRKTQMLIVCPKLYSQQEFFYYKTKLNLSPVFQKRFFDFFQKIKSIHELILNSGSSSILLCTPICDSLISNKQTTVLYEYKTFLFFHFLHTLVRNYASSYLTRRGLTAALIDKIKDLANTTNSAPHHSNGMFRYSVDSDATYQFKKSIGGKIWNRGVFISTYWIDKFNENQMQKADEYLLWCRCFGIIEYHIQQHSSSRENALNSLFFSPFFLNY